MNTVNTTSIIINSTETLSEFAFKLSKHTNLGVSQLKHAIAKAYGFNHVTALENSFEHTEPLLDYGELICKYLEDISFENYFHNFYDDLTEVSIDFINEHLGEKHFVGCPEYDLETRINYLVHKSTNYSIEQLLDDIECNFEIYPSLILKFIEKNKNNSEFHLESNYFLRF